MPSLIELAREKRIEENKRRMEAIGLSQAVEDLASKQAEAAVAAPRRRVVVERVLIAEEDLRRSGRDRKAVNYNEHDAFKAAAAALEATRSKRMVAVRRTRTISDEGGSGSRAVRCSGWSPCMGSAGFAAMDRCQQAAEECAEGLANTAFVKVLSQSMVSGGFWCNAPRGMTAAVAQQLGVDYKCSLMACLPDGQAVPEGACHTNLAGDGWTMVWLPRKSEFGFSGGWRSFSLDMKLFPGDCVVVELLPKAQHCGEQSTAFKVVLHIFRALDYETDAEAAARRTADAAAGAMKQEVEAEEAQVEVQVEQAGPEEQPGHPSVPETVFPDRRAEGSPAAVDAAAELSEESQQAQQAAQQAQQPGSGGNRKRQAQLAQGTFKRNRSSLSNERTQAQPAAAQARVSGGSTAAAAVKKGRGSGGKKRAAAGKQAAGTQAAGANKKRQGRNAAAVQKEEEESFDVERILAVRPAPGSGKQYLIKWLGWEEQWNTWEPRAHLDRPLTEYALADGLSLADLE